MTDAQRTDTIRRQGENYSILWEGVIATTIKRMRHKTIFQDFEDLLRLIQRVEDYKNHVDFGKDADKRFVTDLCIFVLWCSREYTKDSDRKSTILGDMEQFFTREKRFRLKRRKTKYDLSLGNHFPNKSPMIVAILAEMYNDDDLVRQFINIYKSAFIECVPHGQSAKFEDDLVVIFDKCRNHVSKINKDKKRIDVDTIGADSIFTNCISNEPFKPGKDKKGEYTRPGNGGETKRPQPVNVLHTQRVKQLLEELDRLTGLHAVKAKLKSLVNLAEIEKLRADKGLKTGDSTLHLVFKGNPGTGKTTVARQISQIYHHLGLLSKGHCIEVDRSKLLTENYGGAEKKTREAVKKAKGGVLFIDEAYELYKPNDAKDPGRDAITTLLKMMEDNRSDLCVIVAGYPELMDQFLESNPGLKSRFSNFIEFEDYSPDELAKIFKKICRENDYEPDADLVTYVKQFFSRRYENRSNINFANARDVRNFFEKTRENQANRLAGSHPSRRELKILKADDAKGIIL